MKTTYVGLRVRLKKPAHKGRRSTSIIISDTVPFGNGIIPGGVKLDLPLDGFSYWNIEDLEIVKRKKK